MAEDRIMRPAWLYVDLKTDHDNTISSILFYVCENKSYISFLGKGAAVLKHGWKLAH